MSTRPNEAIAGHWLATSLKGPQENIEMSQRHTTVPPTRRHAASARVEREGLIAREKTKKQSAKERTALDNRFHRTFFRSGARVPSLSVSATRSVAQNEARKRRASERHVVGCCGVRP